MEWSSIVLSYLASLTARSLVLFAVAAVAILVVRVKSAAARHAVWTVVAAGMLLLAALTPVLPSVPVRVLKTRASAPAQIPEAPRPILSPSVAAAPPTPDRPALNWKDALAAAYALGALILFGRLVFGYLFVRRLALAAAPVARFPDVYSSAWISVPMTIGRKILLPVDWESWEEPKLQAVLAHERTHVSRADWAIALAAGVNRCLYWFHPLAWWLERQLATLAEEACDDSALLLVDSRPYAQALLDMAASVKAAQGRLIWEAMAMAKAAEVRKRIERILDETRQIPRGLTRSRWAALLLCSAPLVWLTSVTQLAAIPQEQPPTPTAMNEFLKNRRQLGPADVALMEQYLTTHPHDIDARAQLILYYYANGIREPRLSHILWLIENHPETAAALFTSRGVLPYDSAYNTSADYQQVLSRWNQAVANHQGDPSVIGNAAKFFQSAGEFEHAERLLIEIGGLQTGPGTAAGQLAQLYGAAILGATGDPKFPNPSPAFAARVKSDLESATNGYLLFAVANTLRAAAQRRQPGRDLPAGVLDLDQHPLLNAAIDLSHRLLARANQMGFANGPQPGRGVPGGIRGGVAGGVMAPGGTGLQLTPTAPTPAPPAPQTFAPLSEAPPAINQPAPVYPPLAMQARIEGVVKLRVVIDTAGRITHMEVTSGHPLLVPAAMEAVRQWTFQAPSAEIRTNLEVPFTLPPGAAPSANPQNGKAYNSAPPRVIRVGGNEQAARLIRKVDPVYPAEARAEHIEGTVTLQITIGEDGRVQSVEPIAGNPILAAAAVDAVKQWVYQATLLNSQPVSVITAVIVPFELN